MQIRESGNLDVPDGDRILEANRQPAAVVGLLLL